MKGSASQKTLSRPNSAYVFFGAKDKLSKERLSLKNARNRDERAKPQHTYKPMPPQHLILKSLEQKKEIVSPRKQRELPAIVRK